MMPTTYGVPATTCRLCSQLLPNEIILDLGFQPPSDEFIRPEELRSPHGYYPLQLQMCEACGHLQLSYHVDPRVLYQHNYPYEQSTTETGRKHYHLMASSLVDRLSAPADSLAIDIGSNVGVLLEGFRIKGMKVLGVDPAEDMARKAVERGIPTIADFFSLEVARRIRSEHGTAHIITGTNVFAHLHYPGNAVDGVKELLSEKGALIFESPHALDLVQNLEYDTIYHEHLGYMSAKPVQKFFAAHSLELFDLEKTAIHGGSMRYFAGHPGAHPISPNVEQVIREEESGGLYDRSSMLEFAERVKDHRMKLSQLLMDLRKQGKRVVGVSAPAKGSTLLNYCHLHPGILDYIAEKAEIKIGLLTPGSNIPIVSDQRLLDDQPDYALILAWNFAEEIMKNLQVYHDRGGRFIIPIPEPRIV
ncbi:MAG: class I SAM-dependent methyltransferase [Patescibacteria group bacterium]